MATTSRRKPAGQRKRSWQSQFREVQAYIREHGALPANTGGRDAACDVLADWLSYQRRRYARDLVDEVERRQLESLPGFKWNHHPERWVQRVQAYATFLCDHEGRSPSARAPSLEERSLAKWWSRNYRKNFDPERTQDLRGLLRLKFEIQRSSSDVA